MEIRAPQIGLARSLLYLRVMSQVNKSSRGKACKNLRKLPSWKSRRANNSPLPRRSLALIAVPGGGDRYVSLYSPQPTSSPRSGDSIDSLYFSGRGPGARTRSAASFGGSCLGAGSHLEAGNYLGTGRFLGLAGFGSSFRRSEFRQFQRFSHPRCRSLPGARRAFFCPTAFIPPLPLFHHHRRAR